MREIKFRAWDIENKKMYNVMRLQIDKTKVKSVSLNNQFDSKVLSYGKFELMQFTGLKDKNGKEIYEGDILQNLFEVGGIRVKRLVEWKEKDACFNITIDTTESYEVIGNKFENPELLK